MGKWPIIGKSPTEKTGEFAPAMSRLPPPTEEEFVSRLQRGDVDFPPLRLRWEAPKVREIDALVRVSWQKNSYKFAAEYKRQFNPKTIEAAAEQARRHASTARLLPMVVVPFLDERALDDLEARSVSGIDLCGNGLIIVPGEWYVRRTGRPNPFRAEGTIKNVYKRSSSVVARLFLVRPEFDSVRDALEELRRRGGRVTLPTVSKVCKRLEDELIIDRKREGATRLRLIQPDKLLDRLADNYSPPDVRARTTGKLRGIEPAEFRIQLRKWAQGTGNRVALTGASSVGAYAVMARDGVEEYYCTDVTGAVRALGDRFQPAERFATVRLLETPDDEVYFDRRDDLVASPIQAFLELSGGDKRDRETAAQIRRILMTEPAPPVAR